MGLNAEIARNGWARVGDFQNAGFLAASRGLERRHAEICGSPHFKSMRHWEYPYVLGAIAPAVRGTVLDAGCGRSCFPFFLASAGFETACCDVDAEDLAWVGQTARRLGVKLEWRRSSLEWLAWTDASFDVVTCVSVLEHARERERIVLELARVLKPRGLLALTVDVGEPRWGQLTRAGFVALLEVIEEVFSHAWPLDLAEAGRLDTAYLKEKEPERLPWRLHGLSLGNILRGRVGKPEFYDVATAGFLLRKK